MNTAPPLPAHLWDDLPPEAQGLILALQDEVAELKSRTPGLSHHAQEPPKQTNLNTAGLTGQAPAKRPPSQPPSGGDPPADLESSPCERLRELVHQSPRGFGKPRSTWTLQLLADVCFETGIVDWRVSASTVRRELRRMRIRWKRSKLWVPSPDPQYALKKARRDRLIEVATKHPDWVLGFVDEVWWSRLQRPQLQAWADGPPLKVHVLKADDRDPDPVAICCYGMLRHDTKKVMLRFAENRPVSGITIEFLSWLAEELEDERKKRLVVVWDDASWHASAMVLVWLKEHNHRAWKEGGVEIIHFELPAGSPWLNDIEHYYRHAKKVIVEPDRKLSAQETVERVCQHFACPLLPYLKGIETAAGSVGS